MTRRYALIPVIAALALCAGPALAKDAPKETLEATATRVHELEKANVVLQEDLARTRLQLDLAKDALAKTRADLDAETTARKILEAQVSTNQQQATRDLASSDEATKKMLADLTKQLQALSARHDAELASMKKDYDARVASLQDALDKETAARVALDKSSSQQMAKLNKQQNKDRMWGYVFSGLNLGLGLAK